MGLVKEENGNLEGHVAAWWKLTTVRSNETKFGFALLMLSVYRCELRFT